MSSNCYSEFVPLPGNKVSHPSEFITFNESPSVMETVQFDGQKILGKSIADQDKKKMTQNGGGMSFSDINQSLNCDNIHPEYPQYRYSDTNSECPTSYHNHVLTRFSLQRINNSPMFHPLSSDPAHQSFATGNHNLTLATPVVAHSVRQ